MYDDLSQNLSYRKSGLLLFTWVFGFSTGSIDSICLDEESDLKVIYRPTPNLKACKAWFWDKSCITWFFVQYSQ